MGWMRAKPRRLPAPMVYTPALPAIYVSPVGLVANSPAAAAANTTAIQDAADDALAEGKTLVLPNGIYYHNDTITFDSIEVMGSGSTELVGSDGTTTPNCALILTGTAPKLIGVRVSRDATVRGSANDEAGILVTSATGFLVDYITSIGAASAGLFVAQSTDGAVRRSLVINSLADGFHISDVTSDVDVEDCSVLGSGDDYFAVVSYIPQGAYCSDIRFRRCIGAEQKTTGRGFAVVGGKTVSFTDCHAISSLGNGFYVASELAYDTFGTRDIRFEDCSSVSSAIDGCRVSGRSGVVGSGDYSADELTSERVSFVRCRIDGAGAKGVTVLPYSVDVAIDADIANISGSAVEFQGANGLEITGSMTNIANYGVVAGVTASTGSLHIYSLVTNNIGTADTFYDVFNLSAALCDGMTLLIESVTDTRDAAYGERFLESSTTTGGTVRNVSTPRSSLAPAWTFE